MAGKEEATTVLLLSSGGPQRLKDTNILEYIQGLSHPDHGVNFAVTNNLDDETIFANDVYDNVLVFLYRGETAELFPQVYSQEGDEFETALPIMLDRDENQWVKLEKDRRLGYSLQTPARGYEPLLSGEQKVTPPNSGVFLELVADPNFAEVAFIRYNTEDRSRIKFTVDLAPDRDLRDYFTEKIRHIKRYYQRVMLERTPTTAAAKKKKQRGGKKQAKKSGGVARTNAGDPEGAVLWRGPRSPAEMQRVLDEPVFRPHDIAFAAMIGEREYANLVAAISDRRRFSAKSQKRNPFKRAELSPLQHSVGRSAGKVRTAENVVWHRENRYGQLRIERGPTGNLEPVSTMRADEFEEITVIDHAFTEPGQFLDWESHTQHQLIVVPFSGYSILVQMIRPGPMALKQYVVSKDYPAVVPAGVIHSVRTVHRPAEVDQAEDDPESQKFARYFSAVYFAVPELVD